MGFQGNTGLVCYRALGGKRGSMAHGCTDGSRSARGSGRRTSALDLLLTWVPETAGNPGLRWAPDRSGGPGTQVGFRNQRRTRFSGGVRTAEAGPGTQVGFRIGPG